MFTSRSPSSHFRASAWGDRVVLDRTCHRAPLHSRRPVGEVTTSPACPTVGCSSPRSQWPATGSVSANDAIVAVLYFDLDGFKQINDSRGHDAGDAALVSAAKSLVSVARDGDVVARLGGDEFAVLLDLPFLDREDAECEPAERAAAIGERYRSALGRAGDALRASVGVAICRPGVVDAETLLREADMAMYSAKGAGGNRVVVADRIGDHFTLAADGHLEPDPAVAAHAALPECQHLKGHPGPPRSRRSGHDDLEPS
jgi:diguanylate cyclase (GGDEF)-like protein